MEEMYHSVSQQLDEERKRRSTAVQTLTIAENSNADLRQKLKAEEQARKSADDALKGAKTQAESQRKLTNEVKEQLAASKEQVAALKQQLVNHDFPYIVPTNSKGNHQSIIMWLYGSLFVRI